MDTNVRHWHGICFNRFIRLIELLNTNDRTQNEALYVSNVKDEYARFNVWAGNIAAHQAGRASLDFRLREASHVKAQVVDILRYLSETLQDAISILDGSRLPYEEVATSSDDDSSSEDQASNSSHGNERPPVDRSSGSELSQLAQSIVAMVSNLFKMSTIIRKGNISVDRLLKSTNIKVAFFEQYDIQHARHKLPLTSDKLLTRMGKANSRRRQYFKYRELHHEKLARPVQLSETDMQLNKQDDEMNESKSSALSRSHSRFEPSELGLSARTSSSHAASTTASTFVAPLEEIKEYDLDVDVYSESGTVSSYQSSVAQAEKPRLPTPPKASRDGRDFECPYCYTICRLAGKTDTQRKREWRRHLFRDLQPYICSFNDCSKAETMFERRSEWFRHETLAHRREWCCNVSGHQAYKNRSDFLEHMKAFHDEAKGQTANVLALFERPMETTTSFCPFCTTEYADGLSARRLERHLARHMESIAVFAFPRNVDAGGNSGGASDVAANPLSQESSNWQSSSDDDNSQSGLAKVYGEAMNDADDVPEGANVGAMIRNFCLAEESRIASVEGRWVDFLLFEWEKVLSHESSTRESSEDLRPAKLMMPSASQLKESLSIASIVMRVYTESHKILKSYNKSETDTDRGLLPLFEWMASSIGRSGSNDISSNLKALHKTLCMTLGVGESVAKHGMTLGRDESDPGNEASWHFLQPQIRISESAVNILYRGLAACRRFRAYLVGPSGESPSHAWKGTSNVSSEVSAVCRNTELLVQLMRNNLFDRHLAVEAERMLWLNEDHIEQLYTAFVNHDAVEKAVRKWNRATRLRITEFLELSNDLLSLLRIVIPEELPADTKTGPETLVPQHLIDQITKNVITQLQSGPLEKPAPYIPLPESPPLPEIPPTPILGELGGGAHPEALGFSNRLHLMLHDLALYIIKEFEPLESLVIPPIKMVRYFESTKLGQTELWSWSDVFDDERNSLSRMFRDLTCEHHLISEPDDFGARPGIPALTPLGFKQWSMLLLEAYPEKEVQRLESTLLAYDVRRTEGQEFRWLVSDADYEEVFARANTETRMRITKAIREHTSLEPEVSFAEGYERQPYIGEWIEYPDYHSATAGNAPQ